MNEPLEPPHDPTPSSPDTLPPQDEAAEESPDYDYDTEERDDTVIASALKKSLAVFGIAAVLIAGVVVAQWFLGEVEELATERAPLEVPEVPKRPDAEIPQVTFTDITLTFEKGQVVSATSSNTERLNEILDTDEGARYIGEFAIGFNPYIHSPMLDILFDEKIAGSFHFTPGQAYEDADNGNRSSIHRDMVMIQTQAFGGGEIHFDGERIRKDGLFVVEDLKPLNPDQL